MPDLKEKNFIVKANTMKASKVALKIISIILIYIYKFLSKREHDKYCKYIENWTS